MDVLEETESFISDYYPTYPNVMNEEKAKKSTDLQDEVIEPIKEEKVEIKEEKIVDKDEVKLDKKPLLMPKNNFIYSGNVKPVIPPHLLRKI